MKYPILLFLVFIFSLSCTKEVVEPIEEDSRDKIIGLYDGIVTQKSRLSDLSGITCIDTQYTQSYFIEKIDSNRLRISPPIEFTDAPGSPFYELNYESDTLYYWYFNTTSSLYKYVIYFEPDSSLFKTSSYYGSGNGGGGSYDSFSINFRGMK